MADTTPIPDDLVELGRVVSAFGVKGWIKIRPYSNQPDVLLHTKHWWLQAPVAPLATPQRASPKRVDVQVCRVHSDHLIAQLQGLTDRDLAEALKGHGVLVSRARFPAPDQEEYYWVDLIGCQLYGDQDGRQVLLGTVSDVSDNGVHAVLHVQDAADEDTRKKTVRLVPFVAAHIVAVDLAARRIDSNWPADF